MTANAQSLAALIQTMPKAELHIHIEGSLEPELIFALAQRNGVSLPYANVAELRADQRHGEPEHCRRLGAPRRRGGHRRHRPLDSRRHGRLYAVPAGFVLPRGHDGDHDRQGRRRCCCR